MLKSRLLIIHPLEIDVPCIDEDAKKLVIVVWKRKIYALSSDRAIANTEEFH
ncbi:MAG: hypothetical protein ACM65M_10450 [Microcoleus sp.]